MQEKGERRAVCVRRRAKFICTAYGHVPGASSCSLARQIHT